jgi:hypothetical protein
MARYDFCNGKGGNRAHTVNDAKGTHHSGGMVYPLSHENDIPNSFYQKAEKAPQKEHPKELLITVKDTGSI